MVLVCASESLMRPVHAHLNVEKRLSAVGKLGLWEPSNDGIIPGEGAACWVLESETVAMARGRTPIARLAAVGLASGQNALGEAIAQLGTIDGPTLVCATSPDARAVDDEEAATLKAQAFADKARVVAPKLLTGDVFSVSPLLAGILATRIEPAAEGLRSLSSSPSTDPFQTFILLSRDPNGAVGAVRLGY
jgi:hypothetical protein